MDSNPADIMADFGPEEKWRIWKNVILIGLAFMIHFTAFWGASNLQSSVNFDDGLGTFTLSFIYGSLIVSTIFLPTIVIKCMGGKWTMATSFLFFIPFIVAQTRPSFYTMIPAGIAMGLVGGPLWCAKCTYLTIISGAYANITGKGSDSVITKFFGIFFMFYSLSQLWGNLISSAVLSSGIDSIHDILVNRTFQNTTEPLFSFNETEDLYLSPVFDTGNICGSNFCPNSEATITNPNLRTPEPSKINLICGIYLACMVTASLIVCFGVDDMSRYCKGRPGSGGGLTGIELLAVTLRQLKNVKQILIFPITMFIGAEQAFIAADFTSAFVSCGWGISNIGFVMICFGVCNGLASFSSGTISKITGRNPVICFAFSLHLSLLVALLVWRPNPENRTIFFAISGLWGLCDALWLVQINSLSGIMFSGNEEAAYSTFRLCEATGSVITYAYSSYLCISMKLYLLIGLLVIGTLGYTGVESMLQKKCSNDERISSNDKEPIELSEWR